MRKPTLLRRPPFFATPRRNRQRRCRFPPPRAWALTHRAHNALVHAVHGNGVSWLLSRLASSAASAASATSASLAALTAADLPTTADAPAPAPAPATVDPAAAAPATDAPAATAPPPPPVTAAAAPALETALLHEISK